MDALILAGGENRRLPVLKGFVKLEGRRIIERNVELLKQFFEKIVISTDHPEQYFYLGETITGDVLAERGPMTGIYSSFCATGAQTFFVIGCDMPFINVILVQHMVRQWKETFQALVPVFEGRPQPLFSIYSKGIAGEMERRIRSGEKRLRGLLEDISVVFIGEQEVRSIDPEGRSFVNINTPEDLEREGGKICLV